MRDLPVLGFWFVKRGQRAVQSVAAFARRTSDFKWVTFFFFFVAFFRISTFDFK